MKKFSRRFAAVLATGALVAAGVSLGASAANADQLTGNIKLFAQGSANGTIAAKQLTGGSSTTNPMYWGITVDSACPAGFRDGASIQIAQNGTRIAGIGQLNTVDLDGTYGTNGLKASDTNVAMDESFTTGSQNPYVDNNKSLETAAPTLVTGSFEIRYYCLADNTSANYVTDKFYSLTLNFDKTAHTWSVPVAKKATTVSATAAADQTAKKITVSGTVKYNGANATDATGTATINQTAPTSAVLATGVALTAGVASFTTGALSPGTYSFTVTYVPDGASAYNGSTSATATGVINGANSGSTNVTFTVDQSAAGSGLTLSNVPAAVDLGHATLDSASGLLKASNATAFSGVTVTDNRQLDAANWSLTGQVGDFTNTTKSGYTLSGSYLGWAPFVQFGPAVAGPAVASAAPPAASGGLKTSSVLATGAVTNGTPVSSVGAALSVAVPSNTVSGTYSALLTLTLAG